MTQKEKAQELIDKFQVIPTIELGGSHELLPKYFIEQNMQFALSIIDEITKDPQPSLLAIHK